MHFTANLLKKKAPNATIKWKNQVLPDAANGVH